MGIHRLRHPPYSPDVAPCDFWLFGSLKMKLERILCVTPTPFVVEAEEVLGDNSMTEWAKVFDEWKDCLKQCIDSEGEYP
jgi:hypothetical protein